MATTQAKDIPVHWKARRLLRGARAASLATVKDGKPHAALVTYAASGDLSLLLLLSRLSEHTRHLLENPNCALLVVGQPAEINPQTAPRISVAAEAEMVADDGLKARFLAIHPYAALYADFADFSLWRLHPTEALWVGGFGQARRLRAKDLMPEPELAARLAAAEAEILAHMNDGHADALARIAEAAGASPGAWQMVGVDVDGCDLMAGEQFCRIHWTGAVATPDDIRSELIRLAEAAPARKNEGAATTSPTKDA
ncbi:MAG: pyridoxamine 5'-phosphate oxidase family protein [Acidobacteriia bacterium]|nr:pyridoxamine 5'-phosphate oxidase family protein [Methyloceanibacter sp.]MCL6491540.1 pyridoxamine 5'-phosphate oxidase family protein [Terriglobia bacterium]